MSDSKYAFIGDVHSQLKPLEEAFNYCHRNSLIPILLGDLFDSQCEVSDAPGVFSCVKQAEQQLGAITLRSNHQHLLEQLAKGETIKLKKDVARTVLEFQRAGICIQDVARWLETFPYLVCLKDSNNLEYRIAHAQIPETIVVPSYEKIWKFHTPTQDELKQLLWGADYSLTDKERFQWMHEKDREWIAVAGHYHKVVNKGKTLVLDAGCGGKTRSWYDKRAPQLLLYEVDKKELKSFEVF